MPKVLIIEDRRENIVFIANNILRPMGYEVITARDGALGLHKAETETPDLIITDLHLPKLSGLQVLEHLQEKNIYIPSIVMTFHGTEETAVRALRLGAKDYLIKPFTFEEMQNALERVFMNQSGSGSVSTVQLEKAQVRIAALEAELDRIRQHLAQREIRLQEIEKVSNSTVKKEDMAAITQRAAAWEEESARLNKMLAKTKYALSKAIKRTSACEEAMAAQRARADKYQKVTHRLAGNLRTLSETMRLMSLDMEKQLSRLTTLTPMDESERGE